MKLSIDLKWKQNMAFEAEVGGHKIMVDTNTESGGENLGPSPKALMLVSLAGCTAMDVVAILKKMHVDLKAFRILTEGDVAEDHPKRYQQMHLIYEFTGHKLPLDKLQKAIDLSVEKYCGVMATLQSALPITYEIKTVEG
jgi:putative redox protein